MSKGSEESYVKENQISNINFDMLPLNINSC